MIANEKGLADTLLSWYWSNKDKIKQNKRFWAQNTVGHAISYIAKEEKRWKNARRGKPNIKHLQKGSKKEDFNDFE